MESPAASASAKANSSSRRLPTALPRQIDGHEIISLLGAGGMGAVYLGYEPLLDRQVG